MTRPLHAGPSSACPFGEASPQLASHANFSPFDAWLHPKKALTYQERVSELISGLNEADGLQEAQEALRGLVDRIVLQPSPETGKLDVMLEGALSGLLALALGVKRKKGLSDRTQAFDNDSELVLVAGGRNRRNLPMLKCAV